MKRIEWVDYCKSFAIFGVVLLHVHATALASEVINAFVMPLFFIVSGYLFSYDRNPDYKRFAAKRFRQLVIPYLWIGAVSYLCWLTVLRKFGSNPGDDVAWYLPLAGLAGGMPTLLIFDIPLWSLLSFFVVEMIYYPLAKRVSPALLCAVFFVVLVAAGLTVADSLRYVPLMLGPSLGGLFFYSLGHWAGGYVSRQSPAWALPASAVVLAVAVANNGEVNFYICDYSNFFWFIVSSISGSVFVIMLSKLISNAGSCALIRFISQSTLIICGFHLLVFAAVKGFALFMLGIEPERLTTGLWPGLAFALVCFGLTLPICYVIRRYFRFLVDK